MTTRFRPRKCFACDAPACWVPRPALNDWERACCDAHKADAAAGERVRFLPLDPNTGRVISEVDRRRLAQSKIEAG